MTSGESEAFREFERKRSDNYAPCGAREGVAGVDQEFLRSTRQGSSAS